MESGTVEWPFQDKTEKITVKNMKQVGFFPQKKRIFVISSCGSQELSGYDTDGRFLFRVKNPPEFEMLYFSRLKDDIMVVCDGGKNQEDEYGRFRYHFLLDINTGKLTQGGLAY